MIRSVAGLAACAAIVFAFFPKNSLPPAAAQPPDKPLSAELTYVPHDAAIFIHLEAAKVWAGPIVRSVREAE